MTLTPTVQSIAFMLECGEHRIAMLGDAFADIIEETIDNKYKDQAKPMECDAIKVSHHGSNGNSSKTLLDRINSHIYFIPGGKGEKYPAWGTFGRIAEKHKDDQAKLDSFQPPVYNYGKDEWVKRGGKTRIRRKNYHY